MLLTAPLMIAGVPSIAWPESSQVVPLTFRDRLPFMRRAKASEPPLDAPTNEWLALSSPRMMLVRTSFENS